MRHQLRICAPLVLILGLCAAPSSAFAQNDTKSQLVQIFSDGLQAMTEKRYEDAVVLYTKSIALMPTAAGHYSRAKAYTGLRRFKVALQDVEKAKTLNIKPGLAKKNDALEAQLTRVLAAEAQRTEGITALTDGRVQEALEKLNASIETQPQGTTFYDIGRAYCEIDDPETARQYGLKAQEEKSFPLTEEEVPKVELLMDNCGKDADPGVISWLTPVGGGVAVLGGGLLVGSGVLGNQSATLLADLQNGNYTDQTDYDNKSRDLNNARGTGQILLYSGAALAVIGIGLVVVDLITPNAVENAAPQEGDAVESASAPMWWIDLAPGRAGAGVGWRF